MAGRPTVMTDLVVGKLEEGFTYGYTDKEACLHAGIHPDTLYEYCKKHPAFSERKEVLKRTPTMLAKRTVFDNLAQEATAKWLLEKTNKEYNPKTQIDHTTSDGSMKPTTIEIVAGGSDGT